MQFAMARHDAGPVDDDIGLRVRTDTVDAGSEQDLWMFAAGEDQFHAATLTIRM